MGKIKKTDPLYPLYLEGLQNAFEELAYSQDSPSLITFKPWVRLKNDKINYPNLKKSSGKWCVFVNTSELDKWWVDISKALREGKLGYEIKCSTGFNNQNASTKKGVIIVYTYDFNDIDDLKRIRQELRNLGVTWKIPYKSDHSTNQGKYAKKGDKNISLYFE